MKDAGLTRLPLMLLMMLTLLAALWAGLIRLGWSLPPLQPALAGLHGPLMVSGFVGTLIALERAVALNQRWAYVAPLLSGVGAILLIITGSNMVAPLLMTLGSAAFLAVSIEITRRQLALYTATMALGALAWLVGNGLWLAGWPIGEFVVWWAAFLVLTIAGERLELSRVLRETSYSHQTFLLAVGLIMAGLILSLMVLVSGLRLASLGFLALSLWLIRYDIARRNVRRAGLTRFIALNLLVAYVWLAVGGLLGAIYAGATAGATYDAWLHALMLGFVFNMIFAHAPIVLPAVTGLTVPFHDLLYGPVLLMNLGLILRVAADLALWPVVRRWAGLLNVVAILWFLLSTAALVVRERRRSATQQKLAPAAKPEN